MKTEIINKLLKFSILIFFGAISLTACDDANYEDSENYDSTDYNPPEEEPLKAFEPLDHNYDSEFILTDEQWLGPPKANQTYVYGSKARSNNVVIVFDGSGSMDDSDCGGRKIDVAKKALQQALPKLTNKANVGLVAFDGNGLYIRKNLNEQKDLNQLVGQIYADGQTPLYEATAMAYQVITDQARRQRATGTYTIVYVTDGESTDYDPSYYIQDVVSHGIPIQFYVIGFCLDGHSMDNSYTNYITANSAESLVTALERVIPESNTYQSL